MTASKISGAALEAGMQLARRLFEKRGNHSEVHLSEVELAALLAIAFQRGYERGFYP